MALSDLEASLRGLIPTLPITLEDAVAVWSRARPHVPKPLLLDVMHDYTAIIVRVYRGTELVFRRELRP